MKSKYSINYFIIIKSNSERVISEGNYLKELEGYVIVYLYEQKILFKLTDIRIDALELNLQEEIKAEKYIETTKKLYGILETYTS